MQLIPVPGFQPKEHVMSRRSVLCYGHDATLLQTRRWIVERAGYSFEAVMQEEAFLQRLCVIAPTLIVLCQTLTVEESGMAARVSTELSPSSSLLLVCTRNPKFVPERQHFLFQACDGPAAFYDTVVRLMDAHEWSSTCYHPEPPAFLT